MRVDGRDITVTGSLLQPLTRRTNDILRLTLAAIFLATVITSSLITRYEWVALERSISEIVGVKRRHYLVRDIFGFRQQGVRDGVAFGEFYATGHVPRFLERLTAAGIELPGELFQERRIEGPATVDAGVEPATRVLAGTEKNVELIWSKRRSADV